MLKPCRRRRRCVRLSCVTKALAALSQTWDETIVLPSGAAAKANCLGLTTQNPMRAVYLTSGPNRRLHPTAGADALEVVGRNSSHKAYLLEKGIWVVTTPGVLFDAPFAGNLIFKGGVSLCPRGRIASLTQTARLNGVEPYAKLTEWAPGAGAPGYRGRACACRVHRSIRAAVRGDRVGAARGHGRVRCARRGRTGQSHARLHCYGSPMTDGTCPVSAGG